jgi:hypothetical protein
MREGVWDREPPPDQLGHDGAPTGMPGRAARRPEVSHQVWANLAHQLGLPLGSPGTGDGVTT